MAAPRRASTTAGTSPETLNTSSTLRGSRPEAPAAAARRSGTAPPSVNSRVVGMASTSRSATGTPWSTRQLFPRSPWSAPASHWV